VVKGRCKATGSIRAVKTIAKTHPKYVDWIREEGKIMKLMDHPNIIKLFEVYEDSKNLYLVMELCTGGGLAERLSDGRYFSESQVAFMMRQVLRTVSYMHKMGICHRDLKPENFLFLTQDPLERNVLKIIDFGVSCVFEPCVELRDKAGTPYYTAPQVLDGRYTEACDLWSCGVIMYVLLCGVPPFMGKTDVEVAQKIKRGNFAFQADAWNKVSEDTKNLIRGLLQYHPSKRFNATEALNHVAIQQRAPRGKDVKLRPSIIDSMRTFAFSSKLKKAALHAVATTSREDQVAPLREIFLALDMDDDGLVTVSDFHTAFEQAGLTVPADLEAIVFEVDANKSGAIDYTEFLAATLGESHYLQKDRCWAAFLVFDRNGDGKITKDELEISLGDPDPWKDEGGAFEHFPEAIADVLQASDLNGDGYLDFSEFMHMMSGNQNGNGKRMEPRTP